MLKILVADCSSGEIKRKLAGPKLWRDSRFSSISNLWAMAGTMNSAWPPGSSAITDRTSARSARRSSLWEMAVERAITRCGRHGRPPSSTGRTSAPEVEAGESPEPSGSWGGGGEGASRLPRRLRERRRCRPWPATSPVEVGTAAREVAMVDGGAATLETGRQTRRGARPDGGVVLRTEQS